MLRLLRCVPFRSLAGLRRRFGETAFSSALPSFNSSKDQSPYMSSPLSTRPEIPNLHHLTRGVVVRSLPKDLDESSLVSLLKSTFSPAFVDLKLDIQGKPAFAVLRYNDEYSVNSALALNKTLISGKKVYVCTINEFIASSPTIGSGHDSRKLILFNLPSSWSSKEIYEHFSQIGSIMKCTIPRNYDKGVLVMNDQKYFNEIIGPQKIDLSRISNMSRSSANVFQDFRSFLLKEFDRTRFLLYYKGVNSGQVFQSLTFIWEKLNKFKDVFALDINPGETEINELFNMMSGQNSCSSQKDKLVLLYSKIFQEFNRTIDEFFPTKGFAKVEFATREQAERAITLAYSLILRKITVQVVFDRDLPDYYFNSKLVSEAYLREDDEFDDAGNTKKEIEVKVNHHFATFNQTLAKEFKFRPMINYSNYADPLISQQVRTEAEARDMVTGIEGIQPFGFEKREKKLQKFPSNSRVYQNSPDDEYFHDAGPEQTTPASERLTDDRQEYTNLLNKEFIMFPERVPVRKEEVKTYQIVPDMEFPSEMPPTKLWSTNGEKTQAYETILTYSQFFHEKIPNSIKKDPSLLQKEKFGDFPFTRHVFEPVEDYNNLNKQVRSLWKRREIIQNIRKKIRNLPEPDEINSHLLRYVELGSEECQVLKEQDDQRFNTDSELEEEQNIIENKINSDKIKQQMREHNKKTNEMVKMMKEIGIPPPKFNATKTFKYEGEEDIDKYIEKLNKSQGVQAKWMKNNLGEQIVYVECKIEPEIDVEEAEMLVEKYGDTIINAQGDDIEIDAEDVEKMEKLKKFKFDPNHLFKILIHHHAYKQFEESFKEYTSTKPIELYGPFTPMAQEFLDSVTVENYLQTFNDSFVEFEEDNDDAADEKEVV